MMKYINLRINILLLVLLALVSGVAAQGNDEELQQQAPKIFLDCKASYPASKAFDLAYIKTEISYINYVRDRKEADVHILITSQGTGANGSEFEIAFIGQNLFAGLEDTLKAQVNSTDSEDKAREKLVNVMKLGLVRYLARTPLVAQLSLNFSGKIKTEEVRNRWNYWVFSLSMNGYGSGQESTSDSFMYGSFSANRITPELKIQLSLNGDFEKNKYTIDEETFNSNLESYSFNSLVVKSINGHWSIGGYASVSASTYNNMDLKLVIAPAIEYDIFPYAQATRKQLRILYRLNFIQQRYHELTIFNKLKETLIEQSLGAAWAVKEPWGSISGSIEFANYFHDFSKNNLYLYARIDLKVWKGLSVNLGGSYSRIRDQLSLPKGEASTEDVLLHLRQLATSYSYYTSFGISYSFGSIYSNVVNPRFGSSSGGTMIMMN
jgi:hypothetical protein